MRDSIDYESYWEILVPVMSRIIDWFPHGAVVLKCGTNALSRDRLGCFNLSILGDTQGVERFKRYEKPLLLHNLNAIRKEKIYEFYFLRRHLPSEILSKDVNQDEENYYSHGKLPAGLLSHWTDVPRGTSVSTISPDRDNYAQVWVKSRVYKYPRHDGPLPRY